MPPITLIENKEYKVEQLKKIFYPHYDEIMQFCKLKKITNTDENNTDSIVTFSFVGCLILRNGAILFLPKYFKDTTVINQQHYMKLLLQVLQKYQKSKIENPLDNEMLHEEDDYLHLFGTISYLIQHYIEYGLYVKEYSEKVLHGYSEIDWQTTIDQGTAYLTRSGAPVYLDVVKDEMEYDWRAPITEIHKSILNKCTTLMKNWGIDEILDWPHVYLEVNENWLSKPNEAQYWIEKAMQTEFRDQNLLLLKNLLLFIKQISSMNFKSDKQLIGSKYFQNIWEKCCAEVLQHDQTLQNHINKPIWASGSNEDKTKKTLKPDFLKLLQNNASKTLLIFDAKYYAIEFQGNHVKHNPGINDVVKQYMYHQALENYVTTQSISKVYNAFLFPSLDTEQEVFGTVTLDFIPNLSSVFLIKLNAEEFFKMYVTGHRWTSKQLDILLKKIDNY